MLHIQTSKGHFRGSLKEEEDLNMNDYKLQLGSLTLCMENSSLTKFQRK